MNFLRRFVFLCIPLLATSACHPPAYAQIGIVKNPTDPAVPEGARVFLEKSKESFFVGENIIVHFGVENNGTKPFTIITGGDYRGAARSLRFIVTAQDNNGVEASDPYPSTFSMGGFGGPQVLKPGEKWFQSLPLIRYRRFETPGIYNVKVQHDLGWHALPGNPLPVAQTQIEVKMPSSQQAQIIIEAIENTPENPGVTVGEKNTHPWVDFSSLSYPIYLPLLVQRINAGKIVFLHSVQGIETPEATHALVTLLKSDALTSQAAAQVLSKRLPNSPFLPATTLKEAEAARQQKTHLIEASYRDEFSAPIREYARLALESNDRDTLRTTASILESIGQPEDLPPLIEALNTRIQKTATNPRWQGVGFEDKGDLDAWQLQDDCLMLIRCGRALLNRGATLPPLTNTTTDSPAVIALSLRDAYTPRTKKLTLPSLSWLHHPIPFIRQLTLESLIPVTFPSPRPQVTLTPELRAILPDLLKDPDVSVRAAACDLAGASRDHTLLPDVLQVLSTARSRWLTFSADAAATLLGGRYQAWQIWANRLDENDMFQLAIEALSKVTGDHGYSISGPIDTKTAALLKPKWLTFLKVNRPRLEAGQLFSTKEAAWPKDLFPKEFSLNG